MLPLIAAALMQVTSPSLPLGTETVISFAGGGALREWERGPSEDVLFVRDRTERWYRVTTTGPCPDHGSLDTLNYTTDTSGTFDRFSRIRFLRFPTLVCGVKSIVTSAPPPSRRSVKHEH